MEKKLVVTNYDNFKDAQFFIEQYFEAEERMKNIKEFFQSFYMSKLIHSENVNKLKPKYVVFDDYDFGCHSWFKEIAGHDLYIDPYNKNTYKRSRSVDMNKLNELLYEISIRLRNEWACYYILDKDNVLHEFIPVEAKDTIKISFDKKSICITGYYFYGFQSSGSFGQAEESVTKVVKTIIIDPSNNNVLDLKTSEKHMSTHKISKHLGHHECHSHAWVEFGDYRTLDTFNYINPYNQIKEYIEDNYANYYKGYIRKEYFTAGSCSYGSLIYLANDQDELDSIYNDIMEHNKDIFKKVFGIELTKEHLLKYNYLLNLRENAIKESCREIMDCNENYEKMSKIPENKYPLVIWYKSNTHKYILDE